MTDVSNAGADLVVLVHVPKTAGMSLRALFRRVYGGETVCTVTNEPNHLADPAPIVSMSASELGRYRVLVGHLPFGIHELIDRPVRYVTFLREPIERTISDYYYNHRESPPDAPIRRLDMADYLRRGHLANLQTRLIGGTIAAREKPADASDLARGKKRLDDSFDAVGLVEQFDESALLLGEALGWRYFLHRRENIAVSRPRRDSLDPGLLEIIEELNQLDIELYRHACDTFAANLEDRGQAFAVRAHALRLVSQGSEAILRSPMGGAARWGWRHLRRFALKGSRR